MKIKNDKPKKCANKNCNINPLFIPQRPLQKCCSYQCALIVSGEKVKKRAEKAIQSERKERIKTLTEHLNDAQTYFNRYIRLRDKELPCISCGRHHQGQSHASHYRSVGACSSLRFNEMNVHKSCSVCNNHKSGNIVEYRIALCKKIGLFNVEWLESQPKMYRWSKEAAMEIKKTYRDKCKELESQCE